MSDDNARRRWLGYEVQHIFVQQIRNGTSDEAIAARTLLNSIGFNIESTGNKIALLRSVEMRDALLAGPASVRDALRAAGFGFNTHDSQPASGGVGSHPEYREFNLAALAELNAQAVEGNWGREARERAVFDLHRFMTNFNADGSIPVYGTPVPTFERAWVAWRGNKDYANLSAAEAGAIDSYRGSFNATPIDDGTDNNSQMRYRFSKALYDATAGVLTAEEREDARKALARAGANGSESGQASSAVSALLHNLQRRSASPITNTEEAVEAIASQLHSGAPDGTGFEALLDALAPAIEFISRHAGEMAGSLADFGESVVAAAGRSVNSILVGLGGNAIGDIVEFLNMAYGPIKKGLQTGDWSDFGGVVAQYGVAAVISSVLVVGSIAVVSAVVGAISAPLAPVAAAFVAAGWAAYGLYDAVINGYELLGKIGADLAAGIEKIGETIEQIGQAIEKYSQIVQRIVANAMDVDFSAPIFNSDAAGQLATKNLVDPLTANLPAFIEGSAGNERFYGKNNAVIDGKGGNDEIYVRDMSTARGGEGNDILAGGKARTVAAGALIDPAKPNGPRAESDLQMLLDGGEGRDWVIAMGGEKAITVGGLGRDWIFNTSQGGELYGDYYGGLSPDGTPAPDTSENADNFWFWADTTIMDAQPLDVLKYFGIPLTGGDANGGIAGHAIMGLLGSAIGMANVTRYMTGEIDDWTGEVYVDHIQPWMLYAFKRDEFGNLDMYISNAFEQLFRGMMAAIGLEAGQSSASIHKGHMKIENVDVVGSRLGILQRDLTKEV
ncbi:MAG TPA: hypothetical protein VEZ70_10005, partial [Allosphingosinicella sp.]|nr:hypothetical protein [Allosphingosinicella sp.]